MTKPKPSFSFNPLFLGSLVSFSPFTLKQSPLAFSLPLFFPFKPLKALTVCMNHSFLWNQCRMLPKFFGPPQPLFKKGPYWRKHRYFIPNNYDKVWFFNFQTSPLPFSSESQTSLILLIEVAPGEGVKNKIREEHWIQRFQTKFKGLNKIS